MGACVVVIEDGDGQVVSGLNLTLVADGSPVPVENGEICYVRSGQYELVSGIPWIDESLNRSSVQIPGNYHATLEERLRGIQVGVRVGAKSSPDNFALTVEVLGATMAFAGPGGTVVNVVVPAKTEVLLSASAEGYEHATAIFDASAVDEEGCFWITLVPE